MFRDSIVVSISACHADDPGSIPGRGVFLTFAAPCVFLLVWLLLGALQLLPDIAQLVERSTVENAAIEWSLVRFRVSGSINGPRACRMESLLRWFLDVW